MKEITIKDIMTYLVDLESKISKVKKDLLELKELGDMFKNMYNEMCEE